ncbi:hypothetical protein CLONEX_01987, partial [[Clostridium] nexile DSM 1787]
LQQMRQQNTIFLNKGHMILKIHSRLWMQDDLLTDNPSVLF